jgi:chromosome segregation ATPase
LIPIVTGKVEGERVSIFNEASGMKNPMSGVLLQNTTGLTLESGPLTVFEGDTYAGESLIDRLKPDEKRFLTYAADLGTTISTKFDSTSENVSQVKIVNGLIELQYKRIENKTYTILNKDDKPKTIIIEHPNRSGWELKDKQNVYEETENYRRFRVVASGKKTSQFSVLEENVLSNTVAISNINSDLIQLYVNRKYIDEATRQSLEKILVIKQQIADLNREISLKNQQLNEINADQNRIRENLKAVGKSEEEKKLIARYTAKLNEGEDSIERLRKELKTTTDSREQLQLELNKMITSLSFKATLK